MKRQFAYVVLDRTQARGDLTRDRVAFLLRAARSRRRVLNRTDTVLPIRSPDPTLDAYMIGSMLIYPNRNRPPAFTPSGPSAHSQGTSGPPCSLATLASRYGDSGGPATPQDARHARRTGTGAAGEGAAT